MSVLLKNAIPNKYCIIISTLLVMLLSACGGGGGSDNSVPPSAPPPAPTPTSPCGNFASSDQCIGIQVGNLPERSFVFHEPTNRMALAPIVIYMHGGGDSPETISDYVDAIRFSDEMGFLAVLPVAAPDNNQGWTWSSNINSGISLSEDTELVSAIIDKLVADNNADPDRVYVVGFSAGAIMGYQLACQMSDKIKSFLSLAGSMRGDVSSCIPPFPVAVHHIHGTNDSNIPINGGTGANPVTLVISHWANEVNGCNGTTSNSEAFSLTVDSNDAVTTTYSECQKSLMFTRVAAGDHFQQFDINNLHQLMEDLFQ